MSNVQTFRVEKQLDSLITSESVEVPPTSYAQIIAKLNVVTAYNLIFATREPAGNLPAIPIPLATTDDAGGVIMVWRVGDKSVIANFGAGANRRSFIYSSQHEHREALDMNELTLRDKLLWLATNHG